METPVFDRSVKLLSESLEKLDRLSPHSYVLGPRSVCASVLMLVAGSLVDSYEEALEHVYKQWGESLEWEAVPGKGALSKARRIVNPLVFKQLWESQLNQAIPRTLRQIALPEERPYVAIDGSWLVLPDSVGVRKRWKQAGKDAHISPQACMVTAIDLRHRLPVAASIVGCDIGERAAANTLLEDLDPNAVLLLDRGYPGRRFLGEILTSGRDFCVRMVVGSGGFNEVNTFWKSEENDAEVIVDLGAAGKRRMRMVRRRFSKGRPMKGEAREKMVILTSLLDKSLYSQRAVLSLYRARWEVETFFRELKINLGIESFHSKDPDCLLQEVYAAMLWMTVLAMAETDIDGEIAKKHGHQKWDDRRRVAVNRAQLSRAIRRQIPKILSSNPSIRATGLCILRNEFHRLAEQAVPKRPGRKAIRHRKRPYGRPQPGGPKRTKWVALLPNG